MINVPERLNTIEISPSGKVLAMGNDNGEVNFKKIT